MAEVKKGRGAGFNPANRFEPMRLELLDDFSDDKPAVPTQFFIDSTREILARNDSPDVPFTYSINPYRGCEHGCIYCFARPYHEYLGYSCGLDFETKIVAKHDAPELLRRSWRDRAGAASRSSCRRITDIYQPLEHELRLAAAVPGGDGRLRAAGVDDDQGCAGAARRRPVAEAGQAERRAGDGHARDARRRAGQKLEPRASPRPAAARAPRAGEGEVPVSVNVAPVIPGLTDTELPAILQAVADAGARASAWSLLRLPYQVKDLFLDWLQRELPERAPKVLGRLRDLRHGKLSDSRFGSRMRGEGKLAESIRALFNLSCRKYGLNQSRFELSTRHFTRGGPAQLQLSLEE